MFNTGNANEDSGVFTGNANGSSCEFQTNAIGLHREGVFRNPKESTWIHMIFKWENFGWYFRQLHWNAT